MRQTQITRRIQDYKEHTWNIPISNYRKIWKKEASNFIQVIVRVQYMSRSIQVMKLLRNIVIPLPFYKSTIILLKQKLKIVYTTTEI